MVNINISNKNTAGKKKRRTIREKCGERCRVETGKKKGKTPARFHVDFLSIYAISWHCLIDAFVFSFAIFVVVLDCYACISHK